MTIATPTTADADQTYAAAILASTTRPDQFQSLQASNATERGWDGWPTPPTPSSLIPELGRLPVSSTVHFQTVAMTKMYDDIPAAKLRKLKDSLLARAADGNNKHRFWESKNPKQDADGLNNWIDSQFFPNFNGMRASERNVDINDIVDRPTDQDQMIFSINNAFVAHGFEILQAQEADALLKERKAIYEKVESWGSRGDDYGENEWNKFNQVVDKQVAEIKGILHGQVDSRVQAEPADSGKTIAALFRDPVSSFEDLLHRLDAAGVTPEDFDDTVTTPAPPNTTHGVDGRAEKDSIEARIASIRQRIVVLPIEFTKVRNGLEKNILEMQFFIRERENGLQSLDDQNSQGAKQFKNEIDSATNRISYFNDQIALSNKQQTQELQQLEDELSNAEWQLTALDTSHSEHQDPATGTPSPDLQAVLSRFLFGVEFDDGRLNPLMAEPDTMDTPAEGVILYHEQGWYARGLALGNLLHSVALAPGEVTQVAMTHWNHRTRSTDSEQTSQDDTTATADHQNRAVQEIQDAALREHTSGGSAANSASDSSSFGRSSTEIDGSVGFLSASASISGTSQSSGSSHNVSHVASYTGGSKDVAMRANQDVAAATQRHAEAARTRRASVVREVSQSEDENLTTRVLANYNHMHAMTVMYFEVIEVYDLKTRIVDAERVIFLPFVLSEVKDLIHNFRAVLIDAANAAGQPALAEAIRHYQPGDAELKDLNKRILKIDGNAAINADKSQPPDGELPTAKFDLEAIKDDINNLPTRFDPVLKPLRERLSELSQERTKALNELHAEVPSFLEPYFEQALRVQWQPLEEEMQRITAQIEAYSTVEQQVRAQLQARHTRLEKRVDSLRRESKRLNDAARLLENLSNGSQRGPFHDNKLYFNQAVWLSLSPGEVLSLVRRRYMVNGEALCESIDPAPVAISGNYVAYRWRCKSAQETQVFKRQYVEPFIGDPDQELKTVSSTIAVPTGGVFGEAVLGQGVSAEKIDLSRFWNWKDSMIPILPTSINPLSAAKPTMEALSAEPGKLDESSAKLGQLQDLPAPSGFGALAQTMQAQVLRDMSGQAMLQTLAEATTKAASTSEQNAAQIASKNLQAGLDFVKDMSSKAISAMAASETGGGSGVLGDMLKGKGGSPSLLGGVLNATGGKGNGDLLSKLAGGKGNGELLSTLTSGKGNGEIPEGQAGTPEQRQDPAGDANLPDSELESKPPSAATKGGTQ